MVGRETLDLAIYVRIVAGQLMAVTIAGKRNLSVDVTRRILMDGENDPRLFGELRSDGRSDDEVRRELFDFERLEAGRGKTAKMNAQRLVDTALGHLGIPRDIGLTGAEIKK